MLKFLFKLIFIWKFRALRPGWRSIVVITAKDRKECNDLGQLLAGMPAKCLGQTPVIAIKKGCDIREITELPDDLLEKIRDAVW